MKTGISGSSPSASNSTNFSTLRLIRVVYHCPERLPPQTFVVTYPGGWLHNHWGRALVGWGVFWEMVTSARRRAFARRGSALRVPTYLMWGEDGHLPPAAPAPRAP